MKCHFLIGFILLWVSWAGAADLEDGVIDYGDPIRVDRTDSSGDHDGSGTYILIQSATGIIVNATPVATEYILSLQNASTPKSVFDESGHLHIGGTDPGYPLHVEGAIVGNTSPYLDLNYGGNLANSIIVDVSGDDTAAAAGVGPFATIFAAVNYLTGWRNANGGVQPAVIFINAGTHTIPYGNVPYLPVYTSLVGTGRDTSVVVMKSQIFLKKGTAIRDLTFVRKDAGSGYLNMFELFALATGRISFHNTDIISEDGFGEAPAGLVTVLWCKSIGGVVDLDFTNCTYTGNSLFLFDGHPSLGDRAHNVNVTMENCTIDFHPSGAGPADPHAPLVHYNPGSKVYRNCTILSDLTGSTNSANGHSVASFNAQDGNEFPADGVIDATFSNCYLAMDNNSSGGSYGGRIIGTNTTATKDRVGVSLYNCGLRRGVNVANDFHGSAEFTLNYVGTNVVKIQDIGNPGVVNIPTEGNQCFGSSDALSEYAAGLQAGWHMDESSGSLDNFEGTAGYDMTTANTPTYDVAAVFDTGLTFALATTEYAEVSSDLGITDWPVTISGWFKTSAVTRQTIFAFADASAETVVYALEVHSTGAVIGFRRNADAKYCWGQSYVQDGEWHYAVLVIASNTDSKLYIDGVLEAINTDSVTWNGGIDTASIGRSGDSSPSWYFDGTIDEVVIYDTALSAAGVKALYGEGSRTRIVDGRTSGMISDVSKVVGQSITALNDITQKYDTDETRSVPVMEDKIRYPHQAIYYGTCTDGSITYTSDNFEASFASGCTPIVTITPILNEDVEGTAYTVHIKASSNGGFTYEVRKIFTDPVELSDVTGTVPVHWVAMGWL